MNQLLVKLSVVVTIACACATAHATNLYSASIARDDCENAEINCGATMQSAYEAQDEADVWMDLLVTDGLTPDPTMVATYVASGVYTAAGWNIYANYASLHHDRADGHMNNAQYYHSIGNFPLEAWAYSDAIRDYNRAVTHYGDVEGQYEEARQGYQSAADVFKQQWLDSLAPAGP